MPVFTPQTRYILQKMTEHGPGAYGPKAAKREPYALSDPYEILGIPRAVDPETLKAAYRKLVLHYHPDTKPDPREKATAEKNIKAINAAYEALSNRRGRASYAQKGETRARPEARPASPRTESRHTETRENEAFAKLRAHMDTLSAEVRRFASAREYLDSETSSFASLLKRFFAFAERLAVERQRDDLQPFRDRLGSIDVELEGAWKTFMSKADMFLGTQNARELFFMYGNKTPIIAKTAHPSIDRFLREFHALFERKFQSALRAERSKAALKRIEENVAHALDRTKMFQAFPEGPSLAFIKRLGELAAARRKKMWF